MPDKRVAPLYQGGVMEKEGGMPIKQSRPFTYLLSYILLAIVAAYVLSNVLFISYCVPIIRAGEQSQACSYVGPLRTLEPYIPIIYRPVRFLKDSNNPTRADAVSFAYSFSWGTALIAFV